MRTYHIFISHAWDYDERYAGIVRLLDSVPSFYWKDFSVPRDAPVTPPDAAIRVSRLTALLNERIRLASCFVLVAGMFVNHRVWVQREIQIARRYGKPIIGVRRRGQLQTPTEIYSYADDVVNWNAISLVTAIRMHA